MLKMSWGFFFVQMSVLQTVAMATTMATTLLPCWHGNNQFLLLSSCLLPFLELASVKYLETQHSCQNDFGHHFNFEKMKNLPKGFLKFYNFLFLIKKKEILT